MARPRRKVRGIIEEPPRSGRLALRFTDQNGIMRKERLGRVSLSFAQAILEKRRTEVKMGLYFPRRSKKAVPFKEIARDFLAYSQVNKRPFKDDKVFMGFWLDAFKDKRADEVTADDIEKGKEELAKSRAPASVNRYLAALKTAFSRAVNKGLERNPVKAVKLFKENNARVRYLTEEEEAALIREIPEEYRPIVTVALHTGLRRGELFDLKRENIDFRTGLITVPRAKNGEARYIPMNEVVRETLRRMPARLRSEYVFVSRLGIPINAHNFYERVFKPAVKRAGISDFRFHDLRHTFASRLAMRGVSLLANKELMGHKSIAMTLRYAHLSPGHLREAVEGLCNGIDGTGVSQLVSQANIGVDSGGLSG